MDQKEETLMNRGTKQVAVAGVLLVMLMGCYLGVRHYSENVTQKQEQEEAAKKKQVTDFAIADVTAFSYHSTGVEVSMEFDGEAWHCLNDTEMEIDTEKVESFLENFNAIESEDEITDAEDFEELGLEKPESSITFTFADGENLTCYVGAYNSVLSVYYFQTSESAAVYTVSGTVAGKLSNTEENFEAEEEEEEVSEDTDDADDVENSSEGSEDGEDVENGLKESEDTENAENASKESEDAEDAENGSKESEDTEDTENASKESENAEE